LRGLDPRNAERVAGHLVAAGTLVDEDPEQALVHARAARDRASRVAVVREAVGVAAYHAGDYAEAAREIRAYRRMSGDSGYRAVLADCERALGRPEVALRLVAEALAEGPDAEELIELRLVEAGARRDLGELAAARLLLEAELGPRPDPARLDIADPSTVRIAAAYADLLEEQGETAAAAAWSEAVSAATPEDDVEFGEVEDEPADVGEPSPEASAPEVVERLPEDDEDMGSDFNAQVEAEVAELLGETEPPDGTER
jgi:tetratricopeptide (TPR) repeat protein